MKQPRLTRTLLSSKAILVDLTRVLSGQKSETSLACDPLLGKLVVGGEASGVRRQGGLLRLNLLFTQSVVALAILANVVHEMHFSEQNLSQIHDFN